MTDSLSGRRIIIAGGSGFLGVNLAKHLGALGADVVIVSRNQPRVQGSWRFAQWDARTVGAWASHLDGAHAIVNLAGRTVDCIKTPENCDAILRSRVEATRVLGEALRQVDAQPTAWVQMSTAHIYGDPADAVCDERSAFGYGLAPTVGRAWEAAFAEALPPAVRPVVLRTSFVLGSGGGALPKLRMLARIGLGGTVSHGRQGMSWLHEADMNRIFERAVVDETVRGAYVATAPNPVSNKVFMRELRRAVGMPIALPAPAIGVRFGARLFLNTDPELALLGRYVVPTRLLDEGFEFSFTDVGEALRDLCRK